MSDDRLHTVLEQLRAEVERLGTSDPAGRARLQALIEDLEGQLDAAADESSQADLLDSLPDTLRQLEVEYPRLTAILGRVASTLSSMGI
ncbi:MAG: DUF4404 family protein [Gammaproteobacteria bacterium]|jgi:hypothetical protein